MKLLKGINVPEQRPCALWTRRRTRTRMRRGPFLHVTAALTPAVQTRLPTLPLCSTPFDSLLTAQILTTSYRRQSLRTNILEVRTFSRSCSESRSASCRDHGTPAELCEERGPWFTSQTVVLRSPQLVQLLLHAFEIRGGSVAVEISRTVTDVSIADA